MDVLISGFWTQGIEPCLDLPLLGSDMCALCHWGGFIIMGHGLRPFAPCGLSSEIVGTLRIREGVCAQQLWQRTCFYSLGYPRHIGQHNITKCSENRSEMIHNHRIIDTNISDCDMTEQFNVLYISTISLPDVPNGFILVDGKNA